MIVRDSNYNEWIFIVKSVSILSAIITVILNEHNKKSSRSSFVLACIVFLQGSVNVLKKLVKTEPTIDSQTGLKKWTPKPEREKFESFIMGR